MQARCGVLTASTIGQLLTTTGKSAKNDKSRRLVMDLLSQRITGIAEPVHQNAAMLRGHDDESEAKLLYSREVAIVDEVGFVTEDKWGFTLGYSPDGLVGDDGLIEVKSRAHALQAQTIIDQVVPAEYMAQIQTGLLVTQRKWCDFISYPAMGGGKMMVLRVLPDPAMHARLLDAARSFESEVSQRQAEYDAALNNAGIRFFDTVRREELEIV
nr:lambda exonuclease family protein [Ameyamaea chiangmaiensis]